MTIRKKSIKCHGYWTFGKYQLRTLYTLHHAHLWNATDVRKVSPISYACPSSHRRKQLVGLQGKETIYGRISHFWRKREEAGRGSFANPRFPGVAAILLPFVRFQVLYRSSPTVQIGKVFKPSSVRSNGRKEHRIGECVDAQFGRDFSLTLERRRHRKLSADRACLSTREFPCEIFVTLERPVLPIEIQRGW